MIFDFAGTVLADAGTEPGVTSTPVNLTDLQAWRAKLPFLKDMRDDLN